jgi:hypothetical protein
MTEPTAPTAPEPTAAPLPAATLDEALGLDQLRAEVRDLRAAVDRLQRADALARALGEVADLMDRIGKDSATVQAKYPVLSALLSELAG